jgi:alcohol dehydrogenase (cytochrome c)/quinohemoprotein ethanol dehydrogenase
MMRLAIAAAALVALAACGKPAHRSAGPADVDTARILNADLEPGNWMTYGRTYDEQRFSPLTKINDQNAQRLGLAWSYDLDTKRGQEATPIVVDGVMYITTAWSKVKALNAKTGELIWAYDPKVRGEWGQRACCDVVNRGVAVWKGKVYFGALDGRLIALDAATGQVAWAVQTTDPNKSQTITGAPRVVKGKVLIGNSGAEYNVRGFLSAYDAETGKLVWRFYTVPGEPGKPDGAASDKALAEIAAPTWRGEWWKYGGGGTIWDSIVYDAEQDLVIFGTDNGDPWNKNFRSPGPSDDLFLTSIIAVKADTGQYVWHYQLNPGDEWDYSATQQMILTDLKIDGKVRKVLMQAPKNGFFYVIDRTNGKLISAKPFAEQTWAKGIDLATGRPIENPEARYTETGESWSGSPSPHGAHSWMPMSYSPKTKLVYIPVQEVGFTYVPAKTFDPKPLGTNMGMDMAANSMPQDPKVKTEVMKSLRGHVAAWDPVKQKEVWRVGQAGPWNGGMVTTAGNVLFQGDAKGRFSAYRADNGKTLWSFDAQSPVIAGPVTYTVDGQQYVAVLSGWGGTYALVTGIVGHKSGNLHNASRVLVFKVGAKGKLPPPAPAAPKVLNTAPDTADAATVQKGFNIYSRYCNSCHGDAVVASGITPDLRYSALPGTEDFFRVVLGGVFTATGMVSWSEVMDRKDAEAAQAYIIHRAHETKAQKARGEPWTG